MKVAILKGGKHKHQESLESAKNIFSSFKKSENTGKKIELDDIYLDKENVWHSKGIKTEPHFVLPHYDAIIDTTHVKDHQKMVRELSLNNIFDHELEINNYRKILYQSNIKTPEHHIYRVGDEVKEKIYHSWRKLHLPVVVKGSNKISPKLISSNPQEVLDHAHFIFNKNEKVILENFIRGRHYHILTISNFRGNKIYKSIALESLQKKDKKEYVRALSLTEKRKKELENLAEQVHNLLDLKISRLDFVLTATGSFYLVNIKNKLNFTDGNVSEALFKNSGITLQEYLSNV